MTFAIVYRKSFRVLKSIDLGGQILNTFLLLFVMGIKLLVEEGYLSNDYRNVALIYEVNLMIFFITMAIWQPCFSLLSLILAPKKYPYRLAHFVFLGSVGFCLLLVPFCIGLILMLYGAFVWYFCYMLLTIFETVHLWSKKKFI